MKKALADDQISEEETQDLLQLFREIEEPLGKSEEPEIIVPEKLFCLVGDFVKGKEAVPEELLAKGAMVKDTLTMKVNYLVVGPKGSKAWKYGNYGGKVAKAKECNAKGKDIKIVLKKALTEALSKIS